MIATLTLPATRRKPTAMLIRSAVAGAALVATLTIAAPPARADFGMMMAHNFEIVMAGVGKQNADRRRQVSVRQVLRTLGQRGYRDFRVLTAPRGVYRILAHRNSRAYVITAGTRDGRILAVKRA
jgi:hypothetical protein